MQILLLYSVHLAGLWYVLQFKFTCVPGSLIDDAILQGFVSELLDLRLPRSPEEVPLLLYMTTRVFRLKTCSGALGVDSLDVQQSPHQHFHIYPVVQQYYAFTPKSADCLLWSGSLQNYMRKKLSFDMKTRAQNATCWRSVDGADTCGGVSYTHELIVSPPVILHIALTSTSNWTIPPTLHPWPSGHPLHDVTYSLTARIYGSHGHFTASLRAENDHVLFYDDMQNDGVIIPESSDVSDIGKNDQDRTPTGTHTEYVLYHLDGGTAAQKRITKHQASILRSLYKLEVSCSDDLASESFVRILPELEWERMPSADWWWKKNDVNDRSQEYVLKGQVPNPRSVLPERAQPELMVDLTKHMVR